MRRFLVKWFPQDFASTTPSFYEMWGVLVAKSGSFDWVEAAMDASEAGEKVQEVRKLFNIVRGEREKFLKRYEKARIACLQRVANNLRLGGLIDSDEKDGKDTEDAEKDKKDGDPEKDEKTEDADVDKAEGAVQNLKV